MSIELIRGELERLFSLEEMLSLSSDLLGFEPTTVGGTASPASFARALTDHCKAQDAIAALIDAVHGSKDGASPQLQKLVHDVVEAPVELKAGASFGDCTITRRIGAGPNGTVYAAKRGDDEIVVKVLHASAVHDRSSLYRFLTRTRLASLVEHDSLPASSSAGFADDKPFVAYDAFEAKPLAARIARTGALHINEAGPLLRGVLEALKALHDAKLVHGALKLENVLVSAKGHAWLVDAGGDLLRSSWVHSDVATTGGNRIKGMAPEQLKGLGTSVASDMYGFGALLYEVLTGKPPLVEATATDLGRPSLEQVLQVVCPPDKGLGAITDAELSAAVDSLVADASDAEAAIALEVTLGRGADKQKVAEAFVMAADQLSPDDAANAARAGESGAVAEAKAEAAGDRCRETKKSLLFRAARLFESELENHERSEAIFKAVLDLDPQDEVARVGYEGALKAQEKYEDLIEMLLDIGQNSDNHSERARALNKIGHLYAGALEDVEQAVFAFAQAVAQDVQNEDFADDLAKAAGDNMNAWAEAMRTLHEVTEHPRMPVEVKMSLYMRLGTWYVEKIARPDLALRCFEAVLRSDPAHQAALEGMGQVYRRAQQWNELVTVLLSTVERAATPERARDLRAEAAGILETRLNDNGRARDLYEATLAEDPGHQKTVDALARIYLRENDHAGYVKILERQADALTGTERAEVLCRIGEIYEDQLSDVAQAQRRFESALAIDPGLLSAIRGLDRVFSLTGRYQELLDNLEAQVAIAATPRQKINLYSRIAGIYDEEFLDHAKAAEALERVLELDSANEGSLTALMRHYRALDRWDEVIELYDRTLRVVTDDDRRVELLMAQGRVLLEQIGSPERARLAYENVLQAKPDHPAALESLAHVRAATGDAMAALSAVESLAEKATLPDAKAEQWIRAAKILEEHGDRDGAIARYKQALDAQPDNPAASAGLRAAYLVRGDANSAVNLVSREIDRTEGKLAKARLFGELAELQLERLANVDAAREAAMRAYDLDPTSAKALLILGDIAFEGEKFHEAATHYGNLAPRLDTLDKDKAKRMLLRFIDSLARAGSTEQAQSTVQALLMLAGDDPKAIRAAARVRLDSGDAGGAIELYEQILADDEESQTVPADEKADVLLCFGKALRLADKAEEALVPLNEAADLNPGSPEPIEELALAYEKLGQFLEMVRVKQRRLTIAEGPERAKLLLDIGEIYATHMKDSTKATNSFVAALEEQPDDRRVLTRLMKLYSEEKDWGKLVEVVIKLADGVDDPNQRSKYVHTAAVVTAQQMNDYAAAIGHLETVVALDSSNERAREEMIDCHEKLENHQQAVDLLKRELEHADQARDRAKAIKVLTRIADLYQHKLEKKPQTISTLEQLKMLAPDDEAVAKRLSDLYGSDTEAYLDKAVAAQMDVLRRNPFEAQTYRSLRTLFTQAKQPDPAWCVCQALHCMNVAEPDEERFFRRMRAETAAEAKQRVSDDDWRDALTHPALDPVVTSIFQLIEPAVMSKNAHSIEELGYQATYALDLSMHPYPLSQTLYYAGGVLGLDLPPTFQNPNDPGGISFLHAHRPSIVLGVPTQAAAFIAARHLTYYRPGLYVRHLVPTGTGLRSWLFAAIRLVHGSFPVAKELESTVKQNVASIEPLLKGQNRAQLTSSVTKLLQSGSIDLKKWVAAVDLSADRAGFIVCHDLEVACEMIKASDESTASVPHRDRIKELTLFSVDKPYFELRKRLGINIDA
jgi:tetratricopeptide (TPR) repeat protein